ncbi:MAG TPA: DJ-1/PfpI family protein, partial [Thermoanaerobaculia bacterium]|nr:DJ-1/PfpI family protein [Thermoanaerobaculia bacterium]
MKWNVDFLLLPQVEILDLAGPLQAFHEAARSHPIRIRICSNAREVTSEQNLLLANVDPLPEAGAGDLIVVPGMPYAATQRIDRQVIRWLRGAADAGAQIASVCTGAFVLGEAGLLDGRRCTTHWTRIGELRRRFPRARVLDDRLFITDDAITTSAGIASGIDMALALIERAVGPLAALDVAREMVVYIRRDGSHAQESVYLDYRTHLHPGIHRVQDELIRNPSRKLALAQLAKTAGMSPRNLTRTFRQATGISVNNFATRVRLELARTLIHDPALSIDAVARRCGFRSARQLRRLWTQHF